MKTEIKEFLENVTFAPLTVKEIRAEDKRAKCDCEMPFVMRKWHDCLGTLVELRLCCLAKKVEELLGLPKGSLFTVFDFEPERTWDCAQKVWHPEEKKYKDLGAPPKWLKQRMQQKGIEIKNLGKTNKGQWG